MFTVKLVELIVFIFTTSYLFACIWIILCEAMEDFYYGARYSETAHIYHDNFVPYYELHDMDSKYIFLIVFYFSFTSLTTVGFGDFAP